jgi:hypothetical protein
MDENLNISLMVQAWADITLDRWLQKIDALKIHNTYELVNSFVHGVISDSGGDPERIEFAFKYYGKFVDMGVGKGISLADIGMRETKRRPKKWYSPVFYAEVKKLTLLLAQKFGRLGAVTICENIDDNAEKWEKQWITV